MFITHTTRQISIILLLIFLFSLFSCTTKSDKVKIGFMVPTFKIERYIKDKDFFTKKAEELGAEVLVADPDNDDQLQIQQAQELIDKGVKVLVVIAVNQNTSAAIVRMAHDAGIKVIAYERLIQNSDLDYFIAFDHFVVGKLMAEYAVQHVPTGNYVLIGGDKTDLNAVLINKGQMEVLDPLVKKGSINIPFNIYTEDWKGSNAYFEMNRFLKYSSVKPDVVLSSNDGMATGIVKSLQENDLAGKVLLSGLDADLIACKRIAKGLQTFTVYKPFIKQATMAAELAVNIAKDKPVSIGSKTMNNKRKDVPVIFIDPIIVDINNIKQTIIADGFYTEKEIFED